MGETTHEDGDRRTLRCDDDRTVITKEVLPPPVPKIGKPMKEEEARAFAHCAICKQKFGKCGGPILFKVIVEQHALNLANVQRQNALGLFLGSGRLAQAMGQDEDITVVINPATQFTICQSCACKENIATLCFPGEAKY